MTELVYLVGTRHDKAIESTPELEEAIKQVSKIEIEGVSSENTDLFTALREPLLILAIWILFTIEKHLSSSKQSRRDQDSVIAIRNKVASKETKPIDQCDASLEEMLKKYYKWYSLPLQGIIFIFLYIYLLGSFYKILSLLTTNIEFSAMLALLLSICFVGLLRLAYFALVETYEYRNRLVVDKVLSLFKEGNQKVMVIYGEAHISEKNNSNKLLILTSWLLKGKTFEAMFKKEGIETKIIKVKFA
jgi:hypothetical protein